MERTVWTRQHENVLRVLEETGRYTAKREYIRLDLSADADLVLEAYDWLVAHSPDRHRRPPDAEYPVWVSYERDATMLPGPGTAILELRLPEDRITPVNIEKWGTILNYSYIPSDPRDAVCHRKEMEARGLSDTQAYLSRFYPELRDEIRKSWERLFDDSVLLGSSAAYGTIWEVQGKWVRNIIR